MKAHTWPRACIGYLLPQSMLHNKPPQANSAFISARFWGSATEAGPLAAGHLTRLPSAQAQVDTAVPGSRLQQGGPPVGSSWRISVKSYGCPGLERHHSLSTTPYHVQLPSRGGDAAAAIHLRSCGIAAPSGRVCMQPRRARAHNQPEVPSEAWS